MSKERNSCEFSYDHFIPDIPLVFCEYHATPPPRSLRELIGIGHEKHEESRKVALAERLAGFIRKIVSRKGAKAQRRS